MWRSALAWQVTLFMGLQSLAYYVTLTWLPEILQEDGMSATRSRLDARGHASGRDSDDILRSRDR